MHAKVKAYTIQELIVVMILTTLVVGMAFSVLGLIQKHMILISNNYSKKNDISMLEQSLCLDFNKHPNLNYHNKLKMLKIQSPMDSITYVFRENSIIKEKDTLYLPIERVEFFFLGELTQKGTVDAIKVTLNKEFHQQQLFVYKGKSAYQSMN